MFPCLFCGDNFHEIELKEHVGNFSAKKREDVATITINIDTNDSDSDLSLQITKNTWAIKFNIPKIRIWWKSEGNRTKIKSILELKSNLILIWVGDEGIGE